MKMLACMLELCLHLLSSWVCSYSSVYLYKLRCNSMGEHWMFMPDVHVGCHLEVRRGSFIWGTPNTSCLICPYHTKLWPTAIDAPFLASFLLTAPPLSQRASQVYLSLCPGPYPCPSMGVRDKSVFYHCGYVIEIHKESLVLLSTWKRQYGSVPCQCCVDRNVTCTGENFYFHFCKQCTAWPEPGTRREWSTAGKELTWPLPLLLQFHGVSQEDAQASVFAGHSDLFNHTDVIHYNTIN